MANNTLLKKIMSISPLIEIIIRIIYYSNFKVFKKFNFNNKKIKKNPRKINFDIIINFLKESGIKKGDLILVHSSYNSVKASGYKPDEILNFLIDLIGSEGTLAMPAMEKYPYPINLYNYLHDDIDKTEYIYDVNNPNIYTGILSEKLFLRVGSIRSLHPINSMVAIGPLAEKIMNNNLINDKSLPHGLNSSWQNCVNYDAKIIGLGVDLTHCCTITKTVEDLNYKIWPVKDWYCQRKFLIKNRDQSISFNLKERRAKWGMLHYAERKMCKDFILNNIIRTKVVEGVEIEIANAKKIINFLNKRINDSYPYFFTHFNFQKFVKKINNFNS